MSCNCPTPNKCNTNEACLCGFEMNIYDGIDLLETVNAYYSVIDNQVVYQVLDSTAFEGVLGQTYELKITYNSLLGRWEMSYFNDTISLDVVIGVYYGDGGECPISKCWDLKCIAAGFNVLGTFNDYFCWQGEYRNGKKSYSFTSSWSGSDINYRVYWISDVSIIPGSAAPFGTPAWVLEEEDVFTPGVWSPTGYLFNISKNGCFYGQYMVEFEGSDTRFSFDDLGVTGYDVSMNSTDCGCCDTEVLLSINNVEYTATVEYDENGNILGYGGLNYYVFTIGESQYYLFYLDGQWVVKGSLSISAPTLASLETVNECPFGLFESQEFKLFIAIGAECFDCCDYYTPRFSNFIKKKKYDLIADVSDIKSREIFGFKCGPEWSDLFRKHLILDVLHCLPYGVLCDDEEQCLINNVNGNCNC